MFELLSICIPTRNRAEMLNVAIRSAVRVFGPSVQFVIGDNGDAVHTETLLKNLVGEYPRAIFKHIKNPVGATYVYNLQTLVDNVQTPWMSIMHDDDLYEDISVDVLKQLFRDESISFIFSDHWVISASAERLLNETDNASYYYGRTVLREGKIEHLGEVAANGSICLDGFYVRSNLAKTFRFNQGFKIFGDSQWLISLASKADVAGYYINKRTFSYRLNPNSVTSLGLDQIELHNALCDVVISDAWTDRALRARLKKHAWVVMRYSIKRIRLFGLISAMLTLIGMRPRKRTVPLS